MTRILTDDQGRTWHIALRPTEPHNDDGDEEMMVRFTHDDEALVECET